MQQTLSLDEIKSLLAGPLARVHEAYRRRLHSQVALMQEVNDYLAARSGKELRTLLVLLSACAVSGSEAAIGDSTVLHAAAVEMLHNASLMHDDVVDRSDTRRGQPSVRSHWDNRLAVLCGDYYLAQAMRLVEEADDREATRIIALTMSQMSEGEVLQQQYIAAARLDTQLYYEILRRKTANLMATCCRLGHPSMLTFGQHYGMAFQLWDDINDYGDDDALPRPPTDVLLGEKNRHIAAARQALAPLPPSPYRNAITSLVDILTIQTNP